MITITKKSSIGESCNFCTSGGSVIHELGSDRKSGGQLLVRLCNECLKAVKEYKP